MTAEDLALGLKKLELNGPDHLRRRIQEYEYELKEGIDLDIRRLEAKRQEYEAELEELHRLRDAFDANGYYHLVLIHYDYEYGATVSVYKLPNGTYMSSRDYVFLPGQNPSHGRSGSIYSFPMVEQKEFYKRVHKTDGRGRTVEVIHKPIEEYQQEVIDYAIAMDKKYAGVIEFEDDEYFLQRYPDLYESSCAQHREREREFKARWLR